MSSPTTERRVIVTWKNDDSRSIVPVAELLVREIDGRPRYEFGYLQGVHQARGLGFQPFLAFPDLQRRYASDGLFPFFQNRVLPTTRPDYVESLVALGLRPEDADVAELLGRSNARRATDRIETFLVPRAAEDGTYRTHFLARAVRHTAGAEEVAAGLRAGNELILEPEPTNPFNPRARRLIAPSGPLGYLPDYLLTDIDALERLGSSPTVHVERVNPPPHPAHHRVLCRLDAAWPDGFEPLRDPRLAPYEAAPVAASA